MVSLEEFFESAKAASTTIPRTTSTSGAGELFFTGALVVDVATGFVADGAGALVTVVVAREGTGGI